jgi:carboxymethylenebutenolidase
MTRYSARAEPVRYRSGGEWIGACLFRPELSAPQPGVMLLPDVPGVDTRFLGLAERFAHVGYVTLAVDLYRGAQPASAAESATLAAQLDPAHVVAHLEDALRWLRSQPFVRSDRIGCAGIGLGGEYAFRLAAIEKPVQAAVSFGGAVAALGGLAEAMRAPLLGMYAGDDERTLPADAARVGAQLAAAGVPHEFVRYPSVRQGFFDERTREFHFESAEDAWSRSNKFFYRYLGEPQ